MKQEGGIHHLGRDVREPASTLALPVEVTGAAGEDAVRRGGEEGTAGKSPGFSHEGRKMWQELEEDVGSRGAFDLLLLFSP